MNTSPAADCYVGLMAGTSLDGVDATVVSFEEAGPRFLASLTEPYPDEVRLQLAGIGPESTLREICLADRVAANAFAGAARAAIRRAGLRAQDIRAIGSHGQTVWHAPEPPYSCSIQIGDPNHIAESCGIDVVADFRRRDIAAGGQGAPLAPLFHVGLFKAAHDRGVINIGGIANITALPSTGQVTGFDTGPGNTLLDNWIRAHRPDTFDRDGRWSAGGSVDVQLLRRMLDDPFFRRPPPRSTGPEYFNIDWVRAHLRDASVEPRDVQATLAELTAATIAAAVRHSLPAPEDILVCGGGVHNTDLMRRLQQHIGNVPVRSTEMVGIPPNWVEAAGFAWLARETIRNRPGNIPAVTGAAHPTVLGGVYRGSTGASLGTSPDTRDLTTAY